MNKLVYLGVSTLGLTKTVMQEFKYDYIKQYGEKAKPCHMETDSFIIYIKTDDNYKDIAEDVKTRFDTSNYELDSSVIIVNNSATFYFDFLCFFRKIWIFVGYIIHSQLNYRF